MAGANASAASTNLTGKPGVVTATTFAAASDAAVVPGAVSAVAGAGTSGVEADKGASPAAGSAAAKGAPPAPAAGTAAAAKAVPAAPPTASPTPTPARSSVATTAAAEQASTSQASVRPAGSPPTPGERPGEADAATAASAGEQAVAHGPDGASSQDSPGLASLAPASPNLAGRALATPVALSQTAEAVEHTIALASARGITQARVALKPAELGSVEIHLRSTAAGLVARVVASGPAAAQTLQQAATELRRSLEQQGVNLLGLDISYSGEERRAGGGATDGRSPAGEALGPSGQATAEGIETANETTLRLPDGVLVDVLA